MNDIMDSDKFFDSLLAMYMIANQYIKIGESIYEFHSDCALNGKSKIMIVISRCRPVFMCKFLLKRCIIWNNL